MENKLWELDLDKQVEGEYSILGRKNGMSKMIGRGINIQIIEEFSLVQNK